MSHEKEPSRVLHVIPRMRPGGVQGFVMNIYRNIDRSRIQFDFAVRSQRPEYYDEEIKTLGGRLFHLPWDIGNPLSIIAYLHGLEAVLRDEGPFVGLHSHSSLYSGHILPVGQKVGIPLCIAHSHSASAAKSSLLRKIWAFIMRRRIRNSATHLLACSQVAAEWLFGPRWREDIRITLIRNAIDITSFAALQDKRNERQQNIALAEDGPFVGHIGRFDPVKNHAFLLDVFSAYRSVCPQAKLVLTGEGPLESRVRRQAEEKGVADAVYFLGVRSDIPQILSSLDLFVLPSLHEGLGIVLIEAQAAGVPCLVSDAVPREVDLGLGLVRFISLNAGTREWVRMLLDLKSENAPSWEERKAALRLAGYDIRTSVKLLEDFYLSSA